MYNKLLIFVDKKDAILMQHISESLLNLGFAPNLKGFTYVKEAIYIYMAKLANILHNLLFDSIRN